MSKRSRFRHAIYFGYIAFWIRSLCFDPSIDQASVNPCQVIKIDHPSYKQGKKNDKDLKREPRKHKKYIENGLPHSATKIMDQANLRFQLVLVTMLNYVVMDCSSS